MADALLSALVSTVLGNITFFPAEMRIAGDLNNELQKLESSLTTIQAVLQDAEQKQRKSQVIKDWLRKLKSVAYDIENVLDVCATEALDRRLHQGFRNQVSRFFSLSNPLDHRMRTAHRLKSLREKLDFIAAEKHQFHLIELGDPEATEPESRETSSLVTESEILGRGDEANGIIDKLVNQVRDNNETSIISIWGMGGLGKTTLAQLVYNDEKVVGVFGTRSWVCVSRDFDIIRLTKAILESIEGSSCNIEELDPLQRRLKEKLIGKRFLLVLDDVWNEYEDKWDRLKEGFCYGVKGSAVIVTTRDEKIALMMSTGPVHHLGCLSEDDSWSLFKKRAFGSTYPGDCVNLEVIGKEILKKCGGVPLAIKALGGLLRFKRKETEWLSVKESELWDLDEGNKVLSALMLSYDNLSPHLRQCFAFCAVFPKDYVTRKDGLIQLWMANGFIPSKPHMDLHDVGCQLFNELTQRSFFIEVKEDELNYDLDIQCKMHDLVHDLALSVAGDECFMINDNEEIEVPKHVHHLSIHQSYSESAKIHPQLYSNKIPLLRSLLIHKMMAEFRRWEINNKNKFLRILDLSGFDLGNFCVVHRYKQLRYLDLSSSSIKVLPNTVSCMHKLQTINLSYCDELEMLPEDMSHLKELVYLYIRGCSKLSCLPVGIGELVHLRRLSDFIVGTKNGNGIDQLQQLDLGGELRVTQLENVKNRREARSANLLAKRNLESLKLEWSISANNVSASIVEDVLSGLRPHRNLKILEIERFGGVKFPVWIMECLLPNLVKISLNFQRCENLPPLGKLICLKVLHIRSNSLQFIGTDFYGDSGDSFPSLEELLISGNSLKEWKTMEGKENFPCLHTLYVTCPQLSEIPILPSLKYLDVRCCSVSLFNSVQSFTSLTSLCVDGVHDLESLPEDAFCNLSSLSTFRILHFQKLSSLPNIWPHRLTALEDLDITGCPELTSLPDSICHLTALRSLVICNLKGLTALPREMGQLTSLSELIIRDCPNLICLPTGLQNLTMLSGLWIAGCPQLEMRCREETGADWHKIAHIPHIEIGEDDF